MNCGNGDIASCCSISNALVQVSYMVADVGKCRSMVTRNELKILQFRLYDLPVLLQGKTSFSGNVLLTRSLCLCY